MTELPPLGPCMCADRIAISSHRVGDIESGRCACGGAFTVARDQDDPTRVHITMPDPRPDAAELSAMRAAVRAAIAGTAQLPGESEAAFRERVRAACVGLFVPSELLLS